MAQLAYNYTMPVAVAGMKADITDDTVNSYAAEGAIPFGVAVIAGTDVTKQVKIPAAAGGVFRGIALHDPNTMQTDAGVAQYATKAAVNVMSQGRVWVRVAGDVAIDAPAFFLVSGANAGQLDDLDDATTDAVPTGKFRTAGTAGGLAILELNMP